MKNKRDVRNNDIYWLMIDLSLIFISNFTYTITHTQHPPYRTHIHTIYAYTYTIHKVHQKILLLNRSLSSTSYDFLLTSYSYFYICIYVSILYKYESYSFQLLLLIKSRSFTNNPLILMTLISHF